MSAYSIDNEAPKGHYTIVHPDRLLETVKANIIGWWRVGGYNIGLQLQLEGEEDIRFMRFEQIRHLQSRAIEDFLEVAK
jgi:hypothetical protein